MRALLTLENGKKAQFEIPDRDLELLEESASIGAQITASEDCNAATEIAYGIIPWGIDRIRQSMKGVHRGDIHPEEEDEHE